MLRTSGRSVEAQATEMEAANAPPPEIQGARQLAAYYAQKAEAKYDEAAKAVAERTAAFCGAWRFLRAQRQVRPGRADSEADHRADPPATLIDTCWARRSLAGILGDRRDFDNLCKGMALSTKTSTARPPRSSTNACE